jgi:hypothetical protein
MMNNSSPGTTLFSVTGELASKATGQPPYSGVDNIIYTPDAFDFNQRVAAHSESMAVKAVSSQSFQSGSQVETTVTSSALDRVAHGSSSFSKYQRDLTRDMRLAIENNDSQALTDIVVKMKDNEKKIAVAAHVVSKVTGAIDQLCRLQ